MARRTRSLALLAAGFVLMMGSPAFADHTDPSTQLSPTFPGLPGTGLAQGTGRWEHIRNFPPNPGSDLEFFRKNGDLYVSSGTLGQGDRGHVGQRIIRLEDDGRLAPEWIADHGSAACTPENPSGTLGLQHDTQVTPAADPQLIIDTTDATRRCHDSTGGGLEFVDVSGLGTPLFQPREIHLTHHAGLSHTVTVDATRPWIVYNSTSDSSGANRPWVDVLDIRSCLGLEGMSLAEKRAACRPSVYRIPFQPEWSQRRTPSGQLEPGSEASCHDITAVGTRIYCAGANATLVFDVAGLTDDAGNVRGTALPCTVRAGTRTTAMVTDCSAAGPGSPSAEGWTFLGTHNHPGRPAGQQNNNLETPADEGVSVSHESDPSPGAEWLFVTDERGGGVVPPGASCTPGADNPYGNGGIHVFDIRNLPAMDYALTPSGEKAIWRSDKLIPAATFCTVHVIEHVPDEQRIVAAYYSQGIKILDYEIDEQGRFTFEEVASYTLPNANTWAAEWFDIRDNGDGTRTYTFLATDIQRGIDVYRWTGPKNPITDLNVGGGEGPKKPKKPKKDKPGRAEAAGVSGLLLSALLSAAAVSRRRRR